MDQLRRPLSLIPPQPAVRRGGAFRGASAFLVLTAAAIVLAAGCSGKREHPWQNSFDSADALSRAVLDAYNTGDAATLARYALTEHELRTTIWPHLPASRPEVGMPWEYFWREHAQRNTGYVKTLLAKHGGQGYDLAAVSFEGSAAYGDVTIHREPALDLRTAGGSRRLRLFGSMAERDGQWKLYSYVVD